jgi:hypothetical protein
MAAKKSSSPKVKSVQPKSKPVAKKPEPQPVVKKPEPKPGRYDIAGKYLGADSPLQLPGGRGMSAAMAAAVRKKPSAYPGYADPSQGTPRYS